MRAALSVSAALYLHGGAGAASPPDRIVLPPDRRELVSPSGGCVLTVSTPDHWQTRFASAELTDQTASGRQTLWRQTLPHSLGPRRGWVTDACTTVLVDGWINVPSVEALSVIGRDGTLLAHMTVDELVTLLGVSRRPVADHGRLGLWLGGEPRWSADQSVMLLPAAGRERRVVLGHGAITVTAASARP